MTPTTVLFNVQQIDLSKLNNVGRMNGDTFGFTNLSQTGSSYDYTQNPSYKVTGHTLTKACYYSNSCKSDLRSIDPLTDPNLTKNHLGF